MQALFERPAFGRRGGLTRMVIRPKATLDAMEFFVMGAGLILQVSTICARDDLLLMCAARAGPPWCVLRRPALPLQVEYQLRREEVKATHRAAGGDGR